MYSYKFFKGCLTFLCVQELAIHLQTVSRQNIWKGNLSKKNMLISERAWDGIQYEMNKRLKSYIFSALICSLLREGLSQCHVSHLFLCQRTGWCEELSTLLCNILLGETGTEKKMSSVGFLLLFFPEKRLTWRFENIQTNKRKKRIKL